MTTGITMSSPENPTYGGRALPNGVMMMGGGRVSVAIRRTDGSIAVETAEFSAPLAWGRRIPFLRGLLAVVGALFGTVKSTGLERRMISDRREQLKLIGRVLLPVVGVSMVEQSLRAVAGSGKPDATETRSRPGILSLTMPLIAFRLIGLSGPGRTLLQYHAAEHMAVNTAEAGLPVETGRAINQSRIHPRCGTTFAVWSLLLTWLMGARAKGRLRSIVAGCAVISVSFELLHFGARHRDTGWVKRLFGLTWQAQLLTTSPPRREHVEVAVAALGAILPNAGVSLDPASEIV